MELLIIIVFFIFIILNSKIVEGSFFSKIKKGLKKIKTVHKKKKEGTAKADDAMKNAQKE